MLYALILDLGYDGERFAGIYSSEEKAKAASFNSGHMSWEIVPVEVDVYRDWSKG